MLEMPFCTSSKGFLRVFSHNDEKDSVTCVKAPSRLRLGFVDFLFVSLTQNDKFLVILSLWRSIHKFKECLKFYGFFATLKMTNQSSSPKRDELSSKQARLTSSEFKRKFSFMDCHAVF